MSVDASFKLSDLSALSKLVVISTLFFWTNAYAQRPWPPIQIQAPSSLSKAMNTKPPEQSRPLNPKYLSKADFLAGARRGELIDYSDSKEAVPIIDSIVYIMAKEYGTPFPDRRATNCFPQGVLQYLSYALETITRTKAEMRSDEPPNFIRYTSSEHSLDLIQGFRNICFSGTVTNKTPYPVVNSLDDFLSDYAVATQDFIDSERAHRVQKYQDEQRQLQAAREERQAREQEDKHQRELALEKKRADEKAAEQKRIEEEHRRIEEEEKKAKEREAAQIAG